MSLARKIILIAGLSLILAGVTFMIIKSEMGANEAILPSSEDSATTTNEDGCAVDQISAGLDHYLVLKDDGTVWAWGDNSEGQLGTSNLLSQANPTQITPLKNIKLIDAGNKFSLALSSEGTLWVWGQNASGNIEGEEKKYLTPVKINITDVVDAAVGETFTLAVKGDGSVWILGKYDGNGSSVLREILGLTNIKAVSANSTPLFLTNSGEVWEWKPGTTVKKIQGLSDVAYIEGANDEVSLAVKSDKTVWGWGRNSFGELALAEKDFATDIPVQIKGLDGVTKISVGANFISALTSDNSVLAWGISDFKNNDKSITTPTKLDYAGEVRDIDAGPQGLICIKTDDTIWTNSVLQNNPRQAKFTQENCQ
ncbi:hypothetical protein A2215_00425 [Candidatus Berkelbacteria bacterium RIFOXYA2_FULL_43_10]|uniref:Uncharacterized protein n=1 Tax=Candidatus Berkelbacteria bacterium RIFOXYA2_FULL_43_10 TaxID=1797472 RepID=A0A1F5E407_9BACT|nr:MAG: hypothetical protein A2215_00425 [Candidatus Berkelbacteria bacterium RIFOXYA2_FULL_43_10]